MAIQQTYKQSEIEKRLKILRRQVYGKSKLSGIKYQTSGKTSTYRSNLSSADLSYIQKDLAKVGLLTFLAIGVQIALYMALKNNLVKLPFV
ncbi:hypothetical protein HYW42_02145 [Candidatus Daviesbacteria bacterium]|nr:hypothetical protein [Candidatus Daviesbacteria bacterium]